MDSSELQDKINNAGRPVLVEFWAPWCGPCRAVAPVIDRLEQRYAGQVDVVRVNIDESIELARALNVMGVPMLTAYRGGQEVARVLGSRPAPVFEQLFADLAGGAPVRKPAMSSFDRALRLVSGFALLAYGIAAGSTLLIILGALVTFVGIYDRCPIWQSISPRLKALFKRPAAR